MKDTYTAPQTQWMEILSETVLAASHDGVFEDFIPDIFKF